MRIRLFLMTNRILLLTSTVALTLNAQNFSRGVGVYPGDPKQHFGPALATDNATYRNLAVHRPAWHSSAYDYNLTAQLVTDGIKETTPPRWLSTATSNGGVLKKNERELVLDHNTFSAVNISGTPAWVQFELAGGAAPLPFDRVEILASARPNAQQPAGWTCIVSGSADALSWTELGRTTGADRPGRDFKPSIALTASAPGRFVRVEFQAASVTTWRVAEILFFDRNSRVEPGGPYHFTSAWKPAGTGEEWVYVDLGASCTFDRVALAWIRRAAEGAIQTSEDAKAWKTLRPLGTGGEIKIAPPAEARFVRVLMTKPTSADGYLLSELEVYGRGGPVPRPRPGSLGGVWRLQRDSLVDADGPSLSKPGFADSSWFPATVPATTLASYLHAGAIPDPDFGDNQL